MLVPGCQFRRLYVMKVYLEYFLQWDCLASHGEKKQNKTKNQSHVYDSPAQQLQSLSCSRSLSYLLSMKLNQCKAFLCTLAKRNRGLLNSAYMTVTDTQLVSRCLSSILVLASFLDITKTQRTTCRNQLPAKEK